MTQDKNQTPPASLPPPGRGSNPASGGLNQPVNTTDPLAALTARFDQLRQEVTKEQDEAETRKEEETKRQDAENKKREAEAERQKRIDENEVKRLKREGDGTSWSGPGKIVDNIWGKWFYKGQPVKVAKYENQFGDNISNLSLGTEQLNVFGSQIDMVVAPFIWMKFGILGAKFAGGKIYNAYQKKWGDPTGRPSVPPVVFTGFGLATGALGVGLPMILGAGGRTLIQLSDNTDMTYFGTSVDVKRHVDSYEITLQKNSKTHYLAVAALMIGVIFIGLANLIVRLAWYNFEPELADKSLAFDPSKGDAATPEPVKDSASKAGGSTAKPSNPKSDPAPTKISPDNTQKEKLSEEWEDQWAFPKKFARTVVPLFEARWVALLILLENSLARQLEWAEWRLKAMKQNLEMAKWDLRKLQASTMILALPFMEEATEELTNLGGETAELEARVAELEAGLTERQAKVDELTTDIKAGEPE
jgi:hypothetical protein